MFLGHEYHGLFNVGLPTGLIVRTEVNYLTLVSRRLLSAPSIVPPQFCDLALSVRQSPPYPEGFLTVINKSTHTASFFHTDPRDVLSLGVSRTRSLR